jgi:hypothetical protein
MLRDAQVTLRCINIVTMIRGFGFPNSHRHLLNVWRRRGRPYSREGVPLVVPQASMKLSKLTSLQAMHHVQEPS